MGEKVKVSRYISGKRPEYASRGRDERSSSESDSSDEEDFTKQRQKSPKHEVRSDEEDEHVFLEPAAPVKFEAEEAADVNDPRLRRLRAARTNVEDRHAGSDEEDAEDDRMSRHRRIHEPEVLLTVRMTRTMTRRPKIMTLKWTRMRDQPQAKKIWMRLEFCV